MKTMILVGLVAVLILSLFPGCSAEAELRECTDLAADQGKQIQDLEIKVASLETEKANLKIEVSDKDTEIASLEEERDAVVGKMSELEEDVVVLKEEVEFLRLPPPDKVNGSISGYVSADEISEKMREMFPYASRRVKAKIRGPYPLATYETLLEFLETDHTESFPECRPNNSNFGDEFGYQLKLAWDESGLPAMSLGLLNMIVVIPSRGAQETWRNVFLTEENGDLVFYEVNPCDDSIIRIDEPSEVHKNIAFLSGGFFK
jgi:uncharacterized coiled-coil protein SlyX